MRHVKGLSEMKKNEILEDMIWNRKDEISGARGNQIATLLIGGVITAAALAAGTMIKPWIFEATRACYAFASAIPVLSLTMIASKQQEINGNKREIDHLNSIKRNGVKRSEIHHKKRIERINELEKAQKKKKVPTTLNALLIIPCLFVWLGGSAATFLSLEAIKIVAASVGMMALTGWNALRLEGKIQEYETRINNLETDLHLENIFGVDVQEKKKSKVMPKKEERKEMSKEKEVKEQKEAARQPSKETIYHYNFRKSSRDIPKQKVKVR